MEEPQIRTYRELNITISDKKKMEKYIINKPIIGFEKKKIAIL